MSSNRLMYDTCETQTRNNESVSPLQYILDPVKYDNCNKCRMELGVIAGAAVSHIQGNLVDLETDLFGITRKASLCPSQKFSSECARGNMANCKPGNITIKGNTCDKNRTINTTPKHLRSCNMIQYKPMPLPPKLDLPTCNK